MNIQQQTETLYQVNCLDRVTGKTVIVGPRVNKKDVLIPLVEQINLAVHAGREKNWHDAHIETLTILKN